MASYVVITTASGATNDDKVGIMTTLGFPRYFGHVRKLVGADVKASFKKHNQLFIFAIMLRAFCWNGTGMDVNDFKAILV